jgi:hypothetical protein
LKNSKKIIIIELLEGQGGGSGGSEGCGHRSSPLPAARLVSSVFDGDINVPDNKATHMTTQFGQFLDHDMSLTPEDKEFEDCCNDDTPNNCFPMRVSPNDTFYKNHSIECLEFFRTLQYCEENTEVIYVLFICFAISSSEKCLRISKTESYGLSRI